MNYGTGRVFDVALENNDPREALLKFDLGAVPSVSNARLVVQCETLGTGALMTEVRALADVAWSEAQVTWSTRPQLGRISQRPSRCCRPPRIRTR